MLKASRARHATVTRRGTVDWRMIVVGGSISLGLAGVVAATSLGCSKRDAHRDWAVENELAVQMPPLPGDKPVTMGSIAPPVLTQTEPVSRDAVALDQQSSTVDASSHSVDTSAATRLAEVMAEDAPSVREPQAGEIIDQTFGRLTAAQVADFDSSDEDEDGGSASDKPGPVEIVPTPRGAPEIKAEIVPTPQGIPEAMMARTPEREPAKSIKTPDVPPSMLDLEGPGLSPSLDDTPATKPDANPRVALIDATNIESAEPEDYASWPVPDVTLFVTGQQHGYIEPCGCTGLENQKGGVARRMTFMEQLRGQGWNLLPIDGGSQVRRAGRQAEIKFQRTAEAFRTMQYRAVGFGPDDLKLGVGELISVAAGDTDSTVYVSANIALLEPGLMPEQNVIETGGMKIGITSILDSDAMEAKPSDEIIVGEAIESAKKSLAIINESKPDFNVLLFFGEEEAAKKLAGEVPGFDMIVVAGGYGEPTYRPELIDGTQTNMIVTGNKGMYAGLVGLYANDEPLRYARVALTHEFGDAPEMRQLMKEYQNQLRDLGLEGLGIKPIRHESGNEFVGTEKCGECHTTAYDIWQGTPHAEATQSLVNPGERGDVPRHFDPECLSCHVTGWNPQKYYPYTSGYLSLETHNHLTGNGCENCHGPGSAHVAAEEAGDADTATRDELRLSMRLPLDRAKDRCMECHDLDNSPDFHEDGAFDDYWSQVEHYGKD